MLWFIGSGTARVSLRLVDGDGFLPNAAAGYVGLLASFPPRYTVQRSAIGLTAYLAASLKVMYRAHLLCTCVPLLVKAMRFSARTAEHSQRGQKIMNNNRKLRLVLECAKLLVEVIRLAVVLLNMAINYARCRLPLHASQMAQ